MEANVEILFRKLKIEAAETQGLFV